MSDPANLIGLGNASNLTNSHDTLCVPQPWVFLFAEMIASCIALPINLFLATALVVFRSKLRSQLVNIYARNVVIACTVSSVVRVSDLTWSIYGLAGGPASYYSDEMTRNPVLFDLWLIHKLLIVVMYVVIAGGIAFVIMALRENLFRVYRTVAGVTEEEMDETLEESTWKTRVVAFNEKHRKAVAYSLIISSWILPIVVAVASAIGFQCQSNCICWYNYVPRNYDRVPCPGELDPNETASQVPITESCSSVWPPLPNMILLLGSGIWILYVILLIGLLIRSNIDFKRVGKLMMSHQRESIRIREAGEGPDIFLDGVVEEDENGTAAPAPEEVAVERSSTIQKKALKRLQMFRHSRKHSSLLLRKLAKHLNALLRISVIYIVGTGLMVMTVSVMIVTFNEDFMERHPHSMIIVFILSPAAECFSAVALCAELPNLRSAVHSFAELILYIISCGCFRS